MKSGRMFWGSFFLSLGGLFLLDRFYPIDIGWWEIWRLWPVVLVMIGVSMLLRQRAVRFILVIISALLLALVLYASFSFLRYGGMRDGSWRGFTDRLSAPLRPGVTTASLKLDLAAARVRIGGETDQLLDAEATGDAGKYVLGQTDGEESESLRLGYEPGVRVWRLGAGDNSLRVRLSGIPVWRIDLDCGAVSADLDLSDRKVEDLRIDAGASAIRLRLGGLVPQATLRVQAGVSSIRVEVPEAVGCEIRSGTGLSNRKFSGFRKEKSGLYRTDNFDTADCRILIRVDAGVSSLHVGRYL